MNGLLVKEFLENCGIIDRAIRPFEGDLLLVGPTLDQANYIDPSFTKSLFEIVYVMHETPNWPLGRYYVFQVKCELYTAAYEKFNTKSPDIDILNSSNNNQVNLDLAINTHLETVKSNLVDFNEHNPFSGL